MSNLPSPSSLPSDDILDSAQIFFPETFSRDMVGDFPKPYYFLDEELFEAALDLFNKQMEISEGITSVDRQRWECKGKIRVSLQLSVFCNDVGKVKSHKDTYFLDVLEAQKISFHLM